MVLTLAMVSLIPGTLYDYIKLINTHSQDNLRCLMVVMEEDGTHGTQVIDATVGHPIIEDEDPITDGGHITNALSKILS